MRVRWPSALFLVLLMLQGSGLLHYLHLRIDHEGWGAAECRACPAKPAGMAAPHEGHEGSATLERVVVARSPCPVCDMQATTRVVCAAPDFENAPTSARRNICIEPQDVLPSPRERGARLARAPPVDSSLSFASS